MDNIPAVSISSIKDGKEILRYAIENDILNLDDVCQEIMKKENINYSNFALE